MEFLSGEEIYDRLMVNDIPAAKNSVLIVTALAKQTIIERERGEFVPFAKLASDLAKKGVKIFLLLAGRPSRPFIMSLRQHRTIFQGLEIRICVRNHMKIVLIDGSRMYLGSANLTGAGMGHKGANRRNFEFGIFNRK